MRYCAALAALTLAACLTPPPPVVPTQLHVARAPAEVVSIATRELTLAGFEITVSDANAGTVVGRRVKSPDDQGADMTCSYRHGSMASGMTLATLTISVAAKAATGGSDVAMNSNVTLDPSKLPREFRGIRDKDCVSSGAVEKKISAALAP